MPQSAIVRTIYDAFARGDIATIVEHMAADVEWEYGVNSTSVPWLQPRRGRDAVPGFFETLGSAVDVHRFEVKELLEGKDVVVALIDIEFTVRATGRRVVEEDEVHVWRFANGQVIRYRHRADTHQQQQACDR
jgi:ketosteroid isomerase-like protein